MTKEEALLLWLDEIGDNLYAYDFSGKKIKKTDYLMNNKKLIIKNELYQKITKNQQN